MNSTVDRRTADCFSDQILRDFREGRLQGLVLEGRVSSHVGSCENCGTRLSSMGGPASEEGLSLSTRSRLNTSAAQATTRHDPFLDESLPAKIDRYLILKELGTGGFAQVLLAKDIESNRLVAIKIPRPDQLLTRASRDAFLNEARTSAFLEHPHIVPLYDYRELEDGRCIVVMKYIEGASLKEIMESERISPRRAARLIATLADALDYAHRRGIRHRDVKPHNILIDKQGTPYLTDFGLALHEDRQHLHANELAGTYPYMSPEQIRGASEELDGRSDLWSLGVVFYELLARRRPFPATSVEGLREQITEQPHRPLGFCKARIPARLARICDGCLKKNPEERYPAAARLADDLRAYLSRPWKISLSLGLALGLMVLLLSAGVGSRPNVPQRVNGANIAGPAPRTLRPAPPIGKHPLPAQKLVPIAWATIDPGDFYVLEPDGTAEVKSSSHIACFETHRPASSEYRLNLTADLANAVSEAGLMVGLHQTAKNPDEFRCLLLSVNRESVEGSMWLLARDCRVRLNEHRHWEVREVTQLDRVFLDGESEHRVRLEIEVKAGQIAGIKYDDQPRQIEVKGIDKFPIPRNAGAGVCALGHVKFQSILSEEREP